MGAGIVGLVFGVLCLSGCTAVDNLSKPDPSAAIDSYEGLFPVIERMRVVHWYRDPHCDEFSYSRGDFVSDPTSSFCEGPGKLSLDAQATRDKAEFEEAVAAQPDSMEDLFVTLAPDGTVTGLSQFGTNYCIGFMYDPRYSRPIYDPGPDVVATPINADWWEQDDCP